MSSSVMTTENGPIPATLRLEVPSSSAASAAVQVVDKLVDAGHAAYLVGGCVRDLVLGHEPKDYDVATDAKPAQVKAAVGKVIEVGVAFGVLRVPIAVKGQRFEIEVATFRAEGDYRDGRHPETVRFTDAREDVLRRDFTINGLLLQPAANEWVVADFVGGLADVRAGVLRAIGDPLLRFGEDHLRVLRMVRFATRFELDVETRTMAAAYKCASQLRKISHERIREELLRMLLGPRPERALKLLGQLKIGRLLWSDLLGTVSLRQRAVRFSRLREALYHAPDETGAFPLTKDLDEALALAVLFALPASGAEHDVARDVGAMLRLSKEVTRKLAVTWTQANEIARLPTGVARIRALRSQEADRALLVLACVEPDEPSWLRWRAMRAGARREDWQPPLWVTGALLRASGHAPSALFRNAIVAAENVQLLGGTEKQAWKAATEALVSPSKPAG